MDRLKRCVFEIINSLADEPTVDLYDVIERVLKIHPGQSPHLVERYVVDELILRGKSAKFGRVP
jgi:hypothetical protein